VFAHASWTERRSDSYTRLAFLGDSVLALAVTAYLYPRLEAERFGAGRLTKIRAQAVSGPSCAAVAERLDVPRRLSEAAPTDLTDSAAAMLQTERVLASVVEAVIGACYLHSGYERTAQAVVEAFGPEIESALEHPVDFKSSLLEAAARPHLRSPGLGQRLADRPRTRPEQEARGAGRRPRRAGPHRRSEHPAGRGRVRRRPCT
jgi:ribonuclease-3